MATKKKQINWATDAYIWENDEGGWTAQIYGPWIDDKQIVVEITDWPDKEGAKRHARQLAKPYGFRVKKWLGGKP